ncbi:MAG: redoxin domain-containing protein [Clostridia bacterium]|nr:redoxin domain-containing protein [Clostridia bacterium]
MKMTKRILSMLLALIMLLAMVGQLVACGGGGETTDSGNGGDNGGTDAKKSYTIEVLTNGGRALEDVEVVIYNKDGFVAGRNTTNEKGKATFELEGTGYTVGLGGLSEGYECEDSYELQAGGQRIVVSTDVIEDEYVDFSSISYQVGDVIHDFSVTTPDGKTYKVSEILDTKKALLLNFWYTDCTWCLKEFPCMQEAYLEWSDEIEILALDSYYDDTNQMVAQFQAQMGLTFPMAMIDASIENAFYLTDPATGAPIAIPGNPFSVVIDRYGVICLIEAGAILDPRFFTTTFELFASDKYEQRIIESMESITPVEKPDVEMDADALENTLVKDDAFKELISFRPDDDEFAWPFIVGEKDGETVVVTSNKNKNNSSAIMYATVNLKAGEAVVFDYFASCELGEDILYVMVGDKDICRISGVETEGWKSACAYVAQEDGEYDIAFLYVKNSVGHAGDDTIYLRNLRLADSSTEITFPTYIPHFAATNPTEDMSDYEDYATVVYNEEDGYYHVCTKPQPHDHKSDCDKNGPILLAGLVSIKTRFSDQFAVADIITQSHEFIVNGENKYYHLLQYCNYATNSDIVGYCPVTEELKGYLVEFVKQNDDAPTTHDNTWLQLCTYYASYGTNGAQLKDPIKGLAPFSAYEAVMGEANQVVYNKMIMPRGLFYKFVPTVSGAYRITSNSSSPVDGWIFYGDFEDWFNADKDKFTTDDDGIISRILYCDSEIGERYCKELLIDPDGDGKYEIDRNNCSMVTYFEAGKEYYIDIAFYDVEEYGSFTFDIAYLGEKFDFFREASSGVFTTELLPDGSMGDIIAGGVKVVLCEDNYYRVLNSDGTYGSLLYADFYYSTNIFHGASLVDLIAKNYFDFRLTEIDHMAYYYKTTCYDVGGTAALAKAWECEDGSAEFEENWAHYQMDDIIAGIYHGNPNAPDYSDLIEEYSKKMLNEKDDEGNYLFPERQGCVIVDKNLAVALQALMEKFTFENVADSWTKLAYYYERIGASVDERVAELENRINQSTDTTFKAEASQKVEALKALLADEKLEETRHNLVDEAIEAIEAMMPTE